MEVIIKIPKSPQFLAPRCSCDRCRIMKDIKYIAGILVGEFNNLQQICHSHRPHLAVGDREVKESPTKQDATYSIHVES